MLTLLFYTFVLFFMSLFSHWMMIFLMFTFLSPFIFFYSMNLSFLSKNSLMCLDSFSILMILLTIWIIFLSLISSFTIFYLLNSFLFIMCLTLMLVLLCLTFCVNNLLLFFFFFEASLLPILFLIIGWGYKIERLNAGLYMFFYTLVGSLPLLISLLYMFSKNFSKSMNFVSLSYLNMIIYAFLIISFLIKMPMFMFHSWLPKAHVEAPVAGSMILAGILLKLGGYGIFRLMMIFKMFYKLNSIWFYMSLWGGIVTSLISVRQSDIKSLIAYSSISHMSLVTCTLLINFFFSPMGSFLMMIAHGFSSSGLFFLVNLMYERSHTRNLFLSKGLISVFPSLSMWWFIFCSFNMAAPPSLNLISEIFMMNLLVSWSFLTVFFLMFMSFLSAVYSLFLYSFLNHGVTFSGLTYLNFCRVREYFILSLHFLPMFLFFLNLEFYY